MAPLARRQVITTLIGAQPTANRISKTHSPECPTIATLPGTAVQVRDPSGFLRARPEAGSNAL
jgi:hypothetical protein